MYQFTKAIEDVIQNCIDYGSGRRKEKEIWIETEWVMLDDEYDVVKLYLFHPTFGVVYSIEIMEIKTNRE